MNLERLRNWKLSGRPGSLTLQILWSRFSREPWKRRILIGVRRIGMLFPLLMGGTRKNVQLSSTDPVATERYTYSWKQQGQLQAAQFLGVGNKLFQYGPPGTPLTLAATFDPETQVLTWLPGPSFASPWTRLGTPTRFPTQDLRFSPGQSSVLYVFF